MKGQYAKVARDHTYENATVAVVVEEGALNCRHEGGKQQCSPRSIVLVLVHSHVASPVDAFK